MRFLEGAIACVALAGCLSVPDSGTAVDGGVDAAGGCTPLDAPWPSIRELSDDFTDLALDGEPWSGKIDPECTYDVEGESLRLDADGNADCTVSAGTYNLSCDQVHVTYLSGMKAYLEVAVPSGDLYRIERHDDGQLKCRMCPAGDCGDALDAVDFDEAKHARWRLISRSESLFGLTSGADATIWQPLCEFAGVAAADLTEVEVRLATAGSTSRVVRFDDLNR